MSAVMVHVSGSYKNIDMTRERVSLILELMAMFLSFQKTFSLVMKVRLNRVKCGLPAARYLDAVKPNQTKIPMLPPKYIWA